MTAKWIFEPLRPKIALWPSMTNDRIYLQLKYKHLVINLVLRV